MKRLLFILSLFICSYTFGQNTHVAPTGSPSPSSLGSNLHHYGRVFNIIDYGAKADGKRFTDGVMTGTGTLTSATANFTAADVGKSILVGGAAASSHDLATIITSFTNSTTVGLAAPGTITNGRFVYGTDNTTAIQNAIWADSAAAGIGKIWIPQGIFCVGGALVTSAFGTNPNSQIYFPVATPGNSTFYKKTNYVIEGETPPNYIPSSFADTLTGLTGSVIYSLINGSGNLPCVFGTKSSDAANNNINYSYFTFKNLSIIVPQNIGNGGASIGGINGYYTASLLTENVLVSADGSIFRSVQPTNEVVGIIGSRQGAEIQTHFKNTLVNNFKYGIFISDGAFVDNVEVQICQYALVIGQTKFNVKMGYFKPMWNNNNILIPNATIGGYLQFGTCVFQCDNMASEIFIASGNWYDYSKIVVDAGNNATADINYTLIQGGVGSVTNGSYNQTGGTGIKSRAIGTPGVLPSVIALGTSVDPNYAFSAKFSDLTGGGAPFPGVTLQNSSASSPGGGQYNIAPFTTTAGNGSVQGQFSANFGSGATAPFTTQGLVFGTRTNDPIILFQNSNQIARLDATGFHPFTTASFDLGTSSLKWRDITMSRNLSVGGNFTLATAGSSFNITEGSSGRVGQVALVAGTKAITITGLTTSSRAFVTLVAPNTTAATVTYQAVCTSNTLTIQANVAAGTINIADVSTLNYFVIN